MNKFRVLDSSGCMLLHCTALGKKEHRAEDALRRGSSHGEGAGDLLRSPELA